jgi:KTSC domain
VSFLSFLSSLVPWKRSLVAGGVPGVSASLSKPQPAPPPMATPVNEDFLHSGTWLTMASSNVEAIRFIWDAQILQVEFKGEDKHGQGYLYDFFDVPASVAHGFTLTSSPGRYHWNHIRDRYQYIRLHGARASAPKTPNVVRTPSEAELSRRGLSPSTLGSGLIPPWQNSPWKKP